MITIKKTILKVECSNDVNESCIRIDGVLKNGLTWIHKAERIR